MKNSIIDMCYLNKIVLKVQQELSKINYTKIYSSRVSEETSESGEHCIPEETGQDSGIDGSLKDITISVKPDGYKIPEDFGDVCEAEKYFGDQVSLLLILRILI